MTGDAPPGAYRETIRVRSYEAARDGCARPGTLLRYLEHMATRASASLGFDHLWYERQGTAWVVREMSLLLGAPARMDEELAFATWVSAYRRVQAFREYAAWDAGGRLVARARGRWAYINRRSGQITPIPAIIIERSGTLDHAMRPRHAPLAPPATEGPHVELTHVELTLTARAYEADSQQHINNCVYLDWLSEALADALPTLLPTLLPTPLPTLLPTLATDIVGDMPRPRFYHIEYLRPLQPGDHVRIRTRATARGSRGLDAWQEIATLADGATAVRARSQHLRPSRARWG